MQLDFCLVLACCKNQDFPLLMLSFVQLSIIGCNMLFNSGRTMPQLSASFCRSAASHLATAPSIAACCCCINTLCWADRFCSLCLICSLRVSCCCIIWSISMVCWAVNWTGDAAQVFGSLTAICVGGGIDRSCCCCCLNTETCFLCKGTSVFSICCELTGLFCGNLILIILEILAAV